jgi:hypothetical protein
MPREAAPSLHVFRSGPSGVTGRVRAVPRRGDRPCAQGGQRACVPLDEHDLARGGLEAGREARSAGRRAATRKEDGPAGTRPAAAREMR